MDCKRLCFLFCSLVFWALKPIFAAAKSRVHRAAAGERATVWVRAERGGKEGERDGVSENRERRGRERGGERGRERRCEWEQREEERGGGEESLQHHSALISSHWRHCLATTPRPLPYTHMINCMLYMLHISATLNIPTCFIVRVNDHILIVLICVYIYIYILIYVLYFNCIIVLRHVFGTAACKQGIAQE